ncbi:glycosyltransferase family 4 protein [Phocaeicola plebeius]|jgi:glycosyltransferase involved in cell wall biosynthesis|uniref:Glycosyltransferase family 1 protein n=1 Tax=Phocaeicola plebeius TaxID=310297 RepID=A0A412H6E4_9BACT|nr:glycosyltransferase family 4 protein [Phocaeicola plebeius]RGR89523.1 glycosyltransferase family 1 protein [Phocaeicola plebeius]RGS07903.1 glycosyltransferase family 1 protein [Phocaeicola plebeius]
MYTPRVLIIATSHKTRGGITSVIKAHQKGEQWKKFHCKWIETHIDKGDFLKLLYFCKGWILFILNLPFYDIVHIHTSEPPSAIRKCLFMWWSKLWKKKVIVHFHAFSPETTINGKYQKVYKYLFSHANKVIVLSQLWEKYVNETFHLGDKIQVIYNPCTTEILPEKYTKQNIILYAGTVNARKGYTDMIKAFAKIAFQYPNWEIVFAGNGEIENGTTLAKELGIDSQTQFLGWISGKDKDKIFKEASIFCLPSYAEGFPMAVLDAWAYGLPVITTPVGGIPDIAKDGENVLLFQPGDCDKLAIQMDRMIKDNILRNHLTKQSIILSQTTFNIDTINKEIGILYKKINQNK